MSPLIEWYIKSETVFRQAIYKNLKHESDNEITNKIKKYFSNSVERDFAIHVLEFIKSKDVCGADRESLAVKIRFKYSSVIFLIIS